MSYDRKRFYSLVFGVIRCVVYSLDVSESKTPSALNACDYSIVCYILANHNI